MSFVSGVDEYIDLEGIDYSTYGIDKHTDCCNGITSNGVLERILRCVQYLGFSCSLRHVGNSMKHSFDGQINDVGETAIADVRIPLEWSHGGLPNVSFCSMEGNVSTAKLNFEIQHERIIIWCIVEGRPTKLRVK